MLTSVPILQYYHLGVLFGEDLQHLTGACGCWGAFGLRFGVGLIRTQPGVAVLLDLACGCAWDDVFSSTMIWDF